MGKKHLKKTKLIFSIICIIALTVFVIFVLVHESKADEVAAKNFLTQYYTAADNTENVYNIFCGIHDSASTDQAELDVEIDNMLLCSYGTCVSCDTLRTLMADRVLLAPDELSARTGVSVTCLNVLINEKTDTSQEENDFTYSADVYIENDHGNCTQIVLEGVVRLEKVDNTWKVTGFYPDENIGTIQLQLKRPVAPQSS